MRHPLRQRTASNFYTPRFVLCGLLFGLLLSHSIYNNTNAVFSPTLTGLNDTVNVILSLSILLLLGIYIIWLIFSIIRSFSEIRKLGVVGHKVRVYGLFTVFAIGGYLVMLVVASFQGSLNNSFVVLVTVAYLNIYCTIISVLYLPSRVLDTLKTLHTIVELDDEVLELPE